MSGAWVEVRRCERPRDRYALPAVPRSAGPVGWGLDRSAVLESVNSADAVALRDAGKPVHPVPTVAAEKAWRQDQAAGGRPDVPRAVLPGPAAPASEPRRGALLAPELMRVALLASQCAPRAQPRGRSPHGRVPPAGDLPGAVASARIEFDPAWERQEKVWGPAVPRQRVLTLPEEVPPG
jgi:hypothetical protein